MTRRMRKDQCASEEAGHKAATYSLWTAPPDSWQTPVESELPLVDLKARVSQLGLTRAEDDDQTKVFKTPVTVEVLSQPTEG